MLKGRPLPLCLCILSRYVLGAQNAWVHPKLFVRSGKAEEFKRVEVGLAK